MLYFAFIPCGLLLAEVCLFDPVNYGLERTHSGCTEYVRQMNAEPNGWGPLDAAKVCIAIRKPEWIDNPRFRQ